MIAAYVVCAIFALSCSKQEAIELPATNPWIEIQEDKTEDKTELVTYNGVPVEILDRLIQSESSWRVDAQNKTAREYSVGLAQVNMKK